MAVSLSAPRAGRSLLLGKFLVQIDTDMFVEVLECYRSLTPYSREDGWKIKDLNI
jgi:hypothetical protein